MNKKKYILAFSIIIFAIIVFSFLQNNKSNSKFSKIYYYLGTVNEITLINEKKSKSEKILGKCDSILKDIDNKMSTRIPASDISKINNNAGIGFVKVSNDTFKVIEESINYSKLSNGIFDPTIGPIVDLWGIGTNNAHIPSQAELDKTLTLVNYKNIILDKKDYSVKLSNPNMKLDLGAIAKGYAADKITDYLKKEGIDNALINLGGNIYTLGNNDSKKFKVGVQDPTKPRGNSIGYILVSNKSIVTSGIYERYIEKDNKIYHHILNPFNGYPFENELLSVTIVSDKSISGDSLSTTAFGLGLSEGIKLIENIDDVDAIFITKNKEIYLTSGIKNSFKLTDENFNIIK